MEASFWKSQWSMTPIPATKSSKGFNERPEELEDQAEVGHAASARPHVLNDKISMNAHGKRVRKEDG
jgi:hypothetical protein